MAVLEPLKVTITNLPEDALTTIQVPNFPANESKGFHSVSLGKTLYIEKSDFKEDSTFKPLRIENLDDSSGILFPYYDFDTKIIFLAGKGDGNIRYYEVVEDAPFFHYLCQYLSSSLQRGLGVMPKRGLDVNRCEIGRFYKLHTVKDLIEPLSMIVPRKSGLFQDDIFPPTSGVISSLSATDWMNGACKDPVLVPLKEIRKFCTPTPTSTTTALIQGVAGLESDSVHPLIFVRTGTGGDKQKARASSTRNILQLSGVDEELFRGLLNDETNAVDALENVDHQKPSSNLSQVDSIPHTDEYIPTGEEENPSYQLGQRCPRRMVWHCALGALVALLAVLVLFIDFCVDTSDNLVVVSRKN